MRLVTTTRDLADSRGEPVPAGTDVWVRFVPTEPHEVVAGFVPRRRGADKRWVGLDRYNCTAARPKPGRREPRAAVTA